MEFGVWFNASNQIVWKSMKFFCYLIKLYITGAGITGVGLYIREEDKLFIVMDYIFVGDHLCSSCVKRITNIIIVGTV